MESNGITSSEALRSVKSCIETTIEADRPAALGLIVNSRDPEGIAAAVEVEELFVRKGVPFQAPDLASGDVLTAYVEMGVNRLPDYPFNLGLMIGDAHKHHVCLVVIFPGERGQEVVADPNVQAFFARGENLFSYGEGESGAKLSRQ